MTLINVIVACSNLVAIPLNYGITTEYIYLPMLASFFYHLAETKHGLPGIYPLNIYAHQLLQVDRLFAVLSFLFVAYSMYVTTMSYSFLIHGIIGLLALVYSERDVIYENIFGKQKPVPSYLTLSHVEFMVSHVVWHYCAFYCLANRLKVLEF